MEKKGKAIPFIEISNDGEFSVNVKAMSMLEGIRNKQVAPIVIGGPWRSGKSFLANRLLGLMKGFQIGSTVKACTKGIWIWSEPILLSNDLVALILDAEGLNSTERSIQTDNKLFALSLLLASMFIYNCRGHISENALEDLSAVSNLTEFIHVKKSETEKGSEFNKYFPSLIWVLRDFSLDLQKKSPNDYLEDNLKPQTGTSEQIIKKNQIRKTITNFFSERECFTLVRPINDEAKISHIEDLNYSDLRPDFTKAMDTVVSKILSRVKGKVINGVPITAEIYLSLAIDYVEALNDNETPTILPALERVLSAEGRKKTEQIFEDFVSNLNSTIKKESQPLENTNLTEAIKTLKNGINLRLLKDLYEFLSPQEYIDTFCKFQKQIEAEIEKVNEENSELSIEFCSKIIESLFGNLQLPNLKNIDQLNESMILQFQKEWERLVSDYMKIARGPEKYQTLVKYILQSGKTNLITNASEYFRKFIELSNQNRSVMNGVLAEMQSSEKKWKAIVSNDEKIIAEKNAEKEELIKVKNELELTVEKITRELKTKDFELKSKENYQNIEISSFKNMTEGQVKDKNMQIDSLSKKVESLKQKIRELETFNQRLTSDLSTATSKIENQSKILEQSIDESKKNHEPSKKQVALKNLFKNIKEILDELKSNINNIEEIGKLKSENVQLKRELSEKDYTHNKKILEIKKDLANETKELKQKYQKEISSAKNEYDMLKSAEMVLKDKLNLSDSKYKSLNKKIENLQNDIVILNDGLKIKEQLVARQKENIDSLNKNEEKHKASFDKLQEEFGKMKAEYIIRKEEIESLIYLMVELVKKTSKMHNAYNDAYNDILTDETKKNG